MKSAARLVNTVPPRATFSGLDGSTARAIFDVWIERAPQRAGTPLTRTPAGFGTLASMRQRRDPSPSAQMVSPVGDAASTNRSSGAVAPAPVGRVTATNVVVPSARHRSSITSVL